MGHLDDLIYRIDEIVERVINHGVYPEFENDYTLLSNQLKTVLKDEQGRTYNLE